MKRIYVSKLAAAGVIGLAFGCAKHTSTTDPMEVLLENQQAMFDLKGYEAVCYTEMKAAEPRADGKQGENLLSTFTAQKPNKMRYEVWEVAKPTFTAPKSAPSIILSSDGKTESMQMGNQYNSRDTTDPDHLRTEFEPWDGFYSLKASTYASITDTTSPGSSSSATYGGAETIDGVVCDKILVHRTNKTGQQTMDRQDAYYFGKADHLVRRHHSEISVRGKLALTIDSDVHEILLDPNVNEAIYKYSPPPGVTREAPHKQVALLASGVRAPDFTASDANQKTVKLSSLRGKVVVIDFWASWCGPCNQSMPHTQSVIKKLTDAGLPVIAFAVDDGEERPGFDSWVSKKRASYPDLDFVYCDPKTRVSSSLYHVTGIPTQFVLDKKGVIRASFVGYGGPSDDLEKAIRSAASG